MLVLNPDFGGLRCLAEEILDHMRSVNLGKRVSNHRDLGSFVKHFRRVCPYLADVGALDKVPWMVRCKSLLLVRERDQGFQLVGLLVAFQELV